MDWIVHGLLAVHVACVSVAASAPLLCIWLEWREARGDAAAGRGGRYLLAVALILFALGGLLGLISGWIQWQQGLQLALSRLPSKVHFGIAELVFSALLMLGHLWWWRRRPQAAAGTRIVRSLMALLAGTNLIYHFPVLFVVVTHLQHVGQLHGDEIDAAGFRQLLVTGTILSRSLHIVLASLVSGGVALMTYAWWRDDRQTAADDDRQTQRGARWALLPAVAQIPVGLWTFIQMPPIAQRRLMGDDLVAALVFVIGLAAALWMTHLLTSEALGGPRRIMRTRQALAATLLTFLCMTIASRLAMAPTKRDIAAQPQPPHVQGSVR